MLARQLGRAEESHELTSCLERLKPAEAVDMLTLVLIGNSSSRA